MEGLIVTILKQGSLAFIGSKIAKALGEKEISEIIAASGWAVIGISGLGPIMDFIIKCRKTAAAIESFFEKIPGF